MTKSCPTRRQLIQTGLGCGLLIPGEAAGDSGNALVDALHLFTGKLLGAFATGRRRRIVTATATMGIRGTACFLNVRPASTYFCTRYGQTELISGSRRAEFEAIHHDPRPLEFRDGRLTAMREAGMQDHTDEQLRRLEGYVGRRPLFDEADWHSGQPDVRIGLWIETTVAGLGF